MNYYSGISGIQLPFPRHMYPEEYQQSSRLAYYSTIFNSIEINSSFYKLPKGQTVEKWVNETTENFRFTFKIWKQITHNKQLEFNEIDIYTFMNVVANTGKKKGSLLLQLPPSCGSENFNRLSDLLSQIGSYNKTSEWDLAVEFRNASWYNEKVYDLMNRHSAAIVIHDMKKSSTPMIESSVLLKYIRFHGPTGNYRGTYDDSFLLEYSTYIKAWLDEGQKVYVYFNNTVGDAFGNLKKLNSYVNTDGI